MSLDSLIKRYNCNQLSELIHAYEQKLISKDVGVMYLAQLKDCYCSKHEYDDIKAIMTDYLTHLIEIYKTKGGGMDEWVV